jgi:hypothetical protein
MKVTLKNTFDPPVGPESISRFIAKAHKLGWTRFLTFGWRGHNYLEKEVTNGKTHR